MRKFIALIMVVLTASMLFSCGGSEDETVAPVEKIDLGIYSSSLEETMKSIFSGDTVANETVMFIEKLEVKTLLFDIDTVISVTSYDGKTTYTEGVDFDIIDGKIRILKDSEIPCITSDNYYNVDESLLYTEYNGKNVKTYWGEGDSMTKYQVCITYTHKDTWSGFTQPCNVKVYDSLIKKLQNKEDVTFFFYGDSITYGANASYIVGIEPKQHSYTMLFTEAIADLFGYKVDYVSTSKLGNTCKVPSKDYNQDNVPTITYVNTAVGGWKSSNGLENYDSYVHDYIAKYGCDLFVLAFGMNDGGDDASEIFTIQKSIMDKVIEDSPEASLMMVSTMVPNPNATNGWYGNQQYQEDVYLSNIQSAYTDKNIPCSVAQMTSVSKSILTRKDFQDYTGNNINHPNDMMSRVYAQTLLQNFIGYENMN